MAGTRPRRLLRPGWRRFMPRKPHFVLAPREGSALSQPAAAAAHKARQGSKPDGGDLSLTGEGGFASEPSHNRVSDRAPFTRARPAGDGVAPTSETGALSNADRAEKPVYKNVFSLQCSAICGTHRSLMRSAGAHRNAPRRLRESLVELHFIYRMVDESHNLRAVGPPFNKLCVVQVVIAAI
jgi:hypothetical protein